MGFETPIFFYFLISTTAAANYYVPKHVKLNNGHFMPHIGLGTFGLRNPIDTVEASIRSGYRLIDTAFIFGNEVQIGNALTKVLKKGVVKRDELFIIGKLWDGHHIPENVFLGINTSLINLNLEYFDLYVMQSPVSTKPLFPMNPYYATVEDTVQLETTWTTMEKLVKLGLAKSIGMTNFNKTHIERILKIANIQPAVLQMECHPHFLQNTLREFCHNNGIQVMCYSPFAGRAGHGFSNKIRYGRNLGKDVFKTPLIEKIAKKYNRSRSQIILRYLMQLGTIPIPKANAPKRVKQNLDVFDFHLRSREMKKLELLNALGRSTQLNTYRTYKEYPFMDCTRKPWVFYWRKKKGRY